MFVAVKQLFVFNKISITPVINFSRVLPTLLKSMGRVCRMSSLIFIMVVVVLLANTKIRPALGMLGSGNKLRRVGQVRHVHCFIFNNLFMSLSQACRVEVH
jgi:formate hydrogenlyase subunit 4